MLCLQKSSSKSQNSRTSDINSLEKENITFEENKKEFNDTSIKAIDLKNKIDNEINNINKLYEKTIDKMTKSFQIKQKSY